MNDLERLREHLAERLPSASLAIDKPITQTGSWFLDAELKGHMVVVEWRADRGFGVSTPSADDFGLHPDEVYAGADEACDRISELLLGRLKTNHSLASESMP